MEELIALSIAQDHEINSFMFSHKYRSWLRYKTNPLALAALAFLFLISLCAIFIPFFSQYTYYDIDLAQANQSPSYAHWCGTDDLGRDIFSRLWYGARISLFVGIAAALIDLII